VTGGGSGFGMGIVETFVSEGAKVVILDITEGASQKLEKANPGAVTFVQGDISVRTDWQRSLDTALKEYGKLDIVVNNAGILIVKVDFTFYRTC